MARKLIWCVVFKLFLVLSLLSPKIDIKCGRYKTFINISYSFLQYKLLSLD